MTQQSTMSEPGMILFRKFLSNGTCCNQFGLSNRYQGSLKLPSHYFCKDYRLDKKESFGFLQHLPPAISPRASSSLLGRRLRTAPRPEPLPATSRQNKMASMASGFMKWADTVPINQKQMSFFESKRKRRSKGTVDQIFVFSFFFFF